MNEDKWIGVDKRSNKLVIRFKITGYPKQFFLATGLLDTIANRERVQQRRDLIAADISLGCFDASLEKYQFKAALMPV